MLALWVLKGKRSFKAGKLKFLILSLKEKKESHKDVWTLLGNVAITSSAGRLKLQDLTIKRHFLHPVQDYALFYHFRSEEQELYPSFFLAWAPTTGDSGTAFSAILAFVIFDPVQ